MSDFHESSSKLELETSEGLEPVAPPISLPKLAVYPQRWLLLLSVILVNNSNTISWLGFAPAFNYVNIYYGKDSADWFSMIFMYCSLPIGILAMWTGRKFGLRTSLYISAVLNGIGSVIRVISSVSSLVPVEHRFNVCLLGQAFASVSNPFTMFLPCQTAGKWFPDTQRALATTLAVLANPLGVLIVNQIVPRIVHEPEDMLLLNVFVSFPCVFAMFIAIISVTSSDPSLPPSHCAASKQLGFFQGVRACLSSFTYVSLMFVLSGGMGMFYCLYTVMLQLLCPSGYSSEFSGMSSTAMILGGMFGATVSGLYVDYTKNYHQTLKMAMVMGVFLGITFLQFTLNSGLETFIITNAVLFGMFGLAAYPVGLEMAAECTYPASESTSSGLIVLAGQAFTTILVKILHSLARELPSDRMFLQVCRVDENDLLNVPKDYTFSYFALSFIALLLLVVLFVFFKPVYLRMEAEKRYLLDCSFTIVGKFQFESTMDSPTEKAKVKSSAFLDIPRPTTAPTFELIVYRRRWIFLLALVLMNVSNTMSWLGYAPASKFANIFYGAESSTRLTMAFLIPTVPVGAFAMWVGRKFGIRTTMYISAIMNVTGSWIRVFSSVDSVVPESRRFAVCIFGQAIASIAFPFIMFIPCQLAASWFPDTQRTLATSIAVLANPFGILLVNLIVPQIVHKPEDMLPLNLIVFLPEFLSSDPPSPPSLSAAKQHMEFFDGLKSCFLTPSYLVLLIVLASGIGLFNCLYTVMPQILCPTGYSNMIAGFCSSALIIGGVFGATLSGIFVGKTRKYNETVKVGLGIAVVIGITFLQLTTTPNIAFALIFTCFFFGFFGLAVYPIGLELAAECTYPVPEAISAGSIVLIGQALSSLFIFVFDSLKKPLAPNLMHLQVCKVHNSDGVNDANDYMISIFIFSIVAAALPCLLLAFFRPVYLRMEAEKTLNGRTAEVRVNEP
ncbi:unnamed protein product [Caenorhabditis auriculariae]|uniref:Major facilitator superfamily (MFS) profile domain-containing protein n=1 Tax=Caenorhabditis auriculariae TaxID=2777116 RepID=A0A8S1HXI1_9PELO|nr:unnamed protein product [Caenorhabditis auriculariae]